MPNSIKDRFLSYHLTINFNQTFAYTIPLIHTIRTYLKTLYFQKFKLIYFYLIIDSSFLLNFLLMLCFSFSA